MIQINKPQAESKRKLLTLILIFLIISGTLLAQNVPQAFKYQTVIRNTSGNTYLNAPIANTMVRLRISIYQSAIGSPVYQEIHEATTNELGLVSLNIGWGEVVLGNFSTIEWGQDDHFLGTEISIPPASFVDMGITQLLSVPYAFVAQRAVEGDADSDPTNELNRDVGFNGTDLSITDAAGTLNVDLSSLDESVEVAAAQATADQAVIDAATAQASTNLAQVTANEATANAAAAQSSANAAQTTADQALSDAATAQAAIDAHIQAEQAAWLMDGNTGTDPTTDFIGTTDETDLVFKINNEQAFRIVYDEDEIGSFAPQIIHGASGNSATGPGATISGGGAATFGFNTAGKFAVVGGGGDNSASGEYSTISGGFENRATDIYTSIGGGLGNFTHGNSSTISGGFENVASGAVSTIPGGAFNAATELGSFAAGVNAKSLHEGTFVWSYNLDNEFSSTGTNQFLINASGGLGVNTNNPSTAVDVNGQIRMRTGAVDGYIPTSNANGVMTWTDPRTIVTSTSSNILDNDHDTKIQVEESADEDKIRFDVQGSQVAIFDNTGKLGLGNNDPQTLLDVNGQIRMRTGATDGFLPVSDANGVLTWTDPHTIVTSTSSNILDNDNDTKIQVEESTDEDKIRFDVQGSQVAIIDNAGKLGLGNDDPQTLLDVNGQIRMRTGAADGYLPISDTNGVMTWTDPSTIISSSTSNIQDGDNDTKIQVEESTDEDKIRFDVQGSQVAIIDNAGKLGLGNDDPQTLLDVNGQIRMRTDAADGFLLVSDANGVMTWTDPNTIISPSPATGIYTVSNGAFNTMNLDLKVVTAMPFASGGSYVTGDGNLPTLIAPINLPHGAVITKVTYHGYDTATDRNLNIFVSGSYFGDTDNGGVSTSYGNTSSGIYSTVDDNVNYTIDNTVESYSILAQPTSGSWETNNSPELSVIAVVIEYEMP